MVLDMNRHSKFSQKFSTIAFTFMEHYGASSSFSKDQMAPILNPLRIVQDPYKSSSSKPYEGI